MTVRKLPELAITRRGHRAGPTPRAKGAAVAVVVAAVALGGCGSGSSGSSSHAAGSSATAGGSTQGGSTTKTFPSYDGPEAKLPTSYGTPVKKPGVSFSVGWLDPNGSTHALATSQATAANVTKALGGTFSGEDAAVNLNTQVSQCNNLLAERVTILAPYPLLPQALAPCVAKARSAGVKVVITQDTPAVAGQPPLPGYDSIVRQSRDLAAYYTAKAAAQAAPSGATFAQIGLALPVPLLDYGDARTRYWAQRFGLKYTGTLNTTADTPTALASTAGSLLAKFPTVRVVFCYDDLAAETLVTTARAQQRKLYVLGANGDPAAVKMIADGEMVGTYAFNSPAIGRQMIYGAYDLLTKQHLPLPEQIAVPGTMVTKANAASFKPYEPEQ